MLATICNAIATGHPRRWTGGLLAAALTLLVVVAPVTAAPPFPTLSGRVVDEAGVLLAGTRDALTWRLKALETKTGDQLVVAVVPSLDGLSVEDYANRLFRQWRLGDKDKNNGVLLLLAMNDHKLRIEVGYGLEGTLPDAIAKLIIERALVPEMRAGHTDAAVIAGVDQISDVLTGGGAEWKRILAARAAAAPVTYAARSPSSWWLANWPWVLALSGFPIIIMLRILFPQYADPYKGSRRGSSRNWDSSGSSFSSSSSSSSGSSDSFSGGGGSSGGGGASGDW
jgi:uncharacterized protein